MKMYPVNILVDSSIFRKENFFASNAIKSLLKLVKSDRVVLHTDEIILNEVIGLMKEEISTLGAIVGKAQILENSEKYKIDPLKSALKNGQLESELIDGFYSFLKENFEFVHNFSDLTGTEVFQKYFKKLPPFGSGKKKNEFPDAFILIGIKNWAVENNIAITLVSSDLDWKAFADEIGYVNYFKELGELVDYLNKNEHLYPIIGNYIRNNKKKIISKATKDFQKLNFSLQGDYDGSVDGILVTGLYLIDHYILEIQEGTAIIDLRLEAVFEAKVRRSIEFQEIYSCGPVAWVIQEVLLRAKLELDISKPKSFKIKTFDFSKETVQVWPSNEEEF